MAKTILYFHGFASSSDSKKAEILKKYISSFAKKTKLIIPMQYGLFSRGKKIRSKILIDVGSLFKINYKLLIIIQEYSYYTIIEDMIYSYYFIKY